MNSKPNYFRKLFLLFLICTCCTTTFGQRMARACGSGCSDFTTTYKSTNECGGGNADKAFTVTNNTNEIMFIELFDKQKEIAKNYGYNGYWKSDGYGTVKPGESTKFESCGTTGENIVFYRIEGAHDRFPKQDEVDAMDKQY